ncbi:methionyl-tRNA formyltransferase [Patescibacteria group bacterium]
MQGKLKDINPQKIKVIFMGTSLFSKEILKALLDEKYNIISVFTQPDKKSGRRNEIEISSVKYFCQKKSLLCFQPQKLDDEVKKKIEKSQPDIIVVAAYGKILPENILSIPKFGSINIHTSLLPRYRGPSPIQNTLLNGEKETGISIMLLDKGMDTGDILEQKKIEITDSDTVLSLSKKLARKSVDSILKTIPRWILGKIAPEKQNDSEATYCKLIEKNDGRIFWNKSANEVYNQFRAFYPWPGIFSFWHRNDLQIRIKFNKIGVKKISRKLNYEVGEVFGDKNQISINTANGVIIVNDLQVEGKKSVSAREFINGYPDFIGSVLR